MTRALPFCFVSSRRRVLKMAGAATLALASRSALGDAIVKLPLPGGPDERPITTAFPAEGSDDPAAHAPAAARNAVRGVRSIASSRRTTGSSCAGTGRSSRPRSMSVPSGWRCAAMSNQSLSLSLDDILALPRVELVAVNQCSGNSRGYFQPRVPGGEWSQWRHGKCALDRGPPEGRARSRGREGRRRAGSLQRHGRAGRRRTPRTS